MSERRLAICRAGVLMLLLGVSMMALPAQELNGSAREDIREEADRKYGLDAELINGEKYHYHFRAAEGDPFFKPRGSSVSLNGADGKIYDDSVKKPLGSIHIGGKLYEDQAIRYDIYKQLVVLDYLDNSGAPASIVLRNSLVDQFDIGEMTFKKYLDEDGIERFGQVVYEGNVSLIYFWRKDYLPELQNGKKTYSFSQAIKETCILHDGQSCQFRNKRGFLNCFSKEEQAMVKARMRQMHVRFKKISLEQMKMLMEYINQMINSSDV